MNVNRVLGSAVLSLVVVFGTTSAQAEKYNWTGESGTDFNWTTEGNWSPTGVPVAEDAVKFDSVDGTVCLDADDLPTVDLYAGKKVVFTGGHTLNATVNGVADPNYVLVRGGIEANGEGTVLKCATSTTGKKCTLGSGASLAATDGGKLDVQPVSFSDNGGMTFRAAGEDSKLSFTMYGSGSTKALTIYGDNSGITFAATDGGTLEFTSYSNAKSVYFSASSPIITADNSGYVNLSKMNGNTGKVTMTCDHGAKIAIGSWNANVAGSTISCHNGGEISFGGAVTYSGNIAETLELAGDGAHIGVKGAITLGYNSTSSKLTFNITPGLDWDETNARLTSTGNMTIYKGTTYNVDVSVFTNFYGTKKMALAKSDGTLAYTAPYKAAWLVKKGEGADKCEVSLAKDGKYLYLTVTRTDVPEEIVAVVNNSTNRYTSVAEAFERVPEGAEILLLKDVADEATIALAEKAVTLNLNGKTLTMNGTDAAISVGEGAKLTVIGGTISAPNGVAIGQTAGELDISNTTILSAGDCVVVSGAGTASLTLGGGNSFTSESGAAIRETREEGAAHTILIDDDCRLATEEGTSTYEGQPSFVASEAFAGKPVVAGTFSSEIAAKYIPDSSKQKQTDGKWRVSLALDPILEVGDVTIDENARATFAYELKELGYGQTTAKVKADYQVVGASGWTTVEIATVTEEPFSGTGVIEGLVDGAKYAFRIYAVAGDRTGEITEKTNVPVPFSKTTWTGAADDDNWTTAANWIDGHVAFVAQGVTISGDYNDQNMIVLDKDMTLSGLVFGGGAKAKISGGHVLTVNEAADKCMDEYQRLFCGANELTLCGAGTAIDVKPVARLGQSSGVKLVVEDGARFTNNKWRLGDNENYTFIATNSGSSITMTIIGNTWAEAGKKDYLFAAYDGATLTVDGTSTYQGCLDQTSNEPVFLADNATVSVKRIRANGGKPTAISDHGGSLWVGSFTPAVDGARVTCQNGGTFGVYGNLQLSESGKTSTLEILGAGSKISTTSGISANGQVLLGNGTADKLTVRLAPAADWVTDGARVSSANLVNLKANVKFVIDLANVTADMMKKPMTILSGNGSSSYAIPGKKNVELVNNDNYVVSFAKVGNTLTMTVDNGPGLMLLIK